MSGAGPTVVGFGCPLCLQANLLPNRASPPVFTDQEDLMKHMFGTPAVHPTCPICATKIPFPSVYDLIEHLKSLHLPAGVTTEKEKLEGKDSHTQELGKPGLKECSSCAETKQTKKPDEQDGGPAVGSTLPPPPVTGKTPTEPSKTASDDSPQPPLLTLANSYLQQRRFTPFKCICDPEDTFTTLFSLYQHQTSRYGLTPHGAFGTKIRSLRSSGQNRRQGTEDYMYRCDARECELTDARNVLSGTEQLWAHQLELKHGGLWHVATALWKVQIRAWAAWHQEWEDIIAREEPDAEVEEQIEAHVAYEKRNSMAEGEDSDSSGSEGSEKGSQGSEKLGEFKQSVSQYKAESDDASSVASSECSSAASAPGKPTSWETPGIATGPAALPTTTPVQQRPYDPEFLKRTFPAPFFIRCICDEQSSFTSMKALYNHQTKEGIEHGPFGNTLTRFTQYPKPDGSKVHYKCEVVGCRSDTYKRITLFEHQLEAEHGSLLKVALAYYHTMHGIAGANPSSANTGHDSAFEARHPLDTNTIKLTYPGILFPCGVCTRISRSLEEHFLHQISTHGTFFTAAQLIRQPFKDITGRWAYKCDAAWCVLPLEDTKMSTVIAHQLNSKHGIMWQMAFHKWKEAWADVDQTKAGDAPENETGDLMDLWENSDPVFRTDQGGVRQRLESRERQQRAASPAVTGSVVGTTVGDRDDKEFECGFAGCPSKPADSLWKLVRHQRNVRHGVFNDLLEPAPGGKAFRCNTQTCAVSLTHGFTIEHLCKHQVHHRHGAIWDLASQIWPEDWLYRAKTKETKPRIEEYLVNAYQCPCNRVYISRKNYTAHLATDHPEAAAGPVAHTTVHAMYRCIQCNVRIMNLKEMFAHIKETAGHGGDGVKAEIIDA